MITKDQFIAEVRDHFTEVLGSKVKQIYESKRATLSFIDELGNNVTIKMFEFWPVTDSHVDPSLFAVKFAVRVNDIYPKMYEIVKKDHPMAVSEGLYAAYAPEIDLLAKQF